MDLSESYKYCRSFEYHGMQYPVLISRLLSDQKRDSIAACFASFRIMADEINHLLRHKTDDLADKQTFAVNMERWSQLIIDSRSGRQNNHPIFPAMADTFVKFDLPLVPWENYRKALKYHLTHDSIPDLKTFREYRRWAYESSISIYIHILASKKEGDGRRLRFNPGLLTADLAGLIFAVDVLTDIKHDLGGENGGFVYLPQDLLNKYNLDRGSLSRMIQSGRTNVEFRRLLNELYLRGREYETFTREKLIIIRGELNKEEWFALDMLVNIFARFLHRIWEFPDAIFSDGYPLDPAMVYINALKLQKDMGLSFNRDIAGLLYESDG